MKISPETLLSAEKARTKKKTEIFVGFAVVWAGVSVAILLLSKGKDYLWYMIADMLLSVAFGWYAVWFFTNPYRDSKNLERLLKTMLASAEVKESGVVEKVAEHTKEALFLYCVTVKTSDGERDLSLLPDMPNDIEEGKSYLFTTRANVIVDSEATNV